MTVNADCQNHVLNPEGRNEATASTEERCARARSGTVNFIVVVVVVVRVKQLMEAYREEMKERSWP